VHAYDVPALANLKAWTRDLMRQAEQDLGSQLDWVAVDHWTTDNPHVHVLAKLGYLASPNIRIIKSRD
jgi:type IV secretory pathway VirD2 relaxase